MATWDPFADPADEEAGRFEPSRLLVLCEA